MKVIKSVFFILSILFIGISIYIAVQPHHFKVSRTRTINAPAPVIYNNVIDFKNWKSWSSWAETNPNIDINLSQPSKGIASTYRWKDKHGFGTMTTLQTTAYSTINQLMTYEGFPPSSVHWQFHPNSDGSTKTTWTIQGKDLPFKFKAFALIAGGMEQQIGPHYERSLEKLDSIVTARMQAYTITIKDQTEHSGGFYIYTTVSCKIADMPKQLQSMRSELQTYALNHDLETTRNTFNYYHKWDDTKGTVTVSYCIPTQDKLNIQDSKTILSGKLPSFKALKTTLKGNYKYLKKAWDTSITYCETNALKIDTSGPMLEVYKNDATKLANPADWHTDLYIALQ